MPTELIAQETRVPRTLQGIEDTSLERLSRSMDTRNPMETECGNKINSGPAFFSAVHRRDEKRSFFLAADQ